MATPKPVLEYIRLNVAKQLTSNQ